jgi:hypothetical protein
VDSEDRRGRPQGPSSALTAKAGVVRYLSFFFRTFVPIKKENMKTIAWAVAAARVEFILLPWPLAL